MDQSIAVADFLGEDRTRQRFVIRVSIGKPYEAPGKHAWVCPMMVVPLLPRLASVEGADPLQALCLAIRTALAIMKDFADAGGSVLHADGTPCPLRTYFPGEES